MIACVLFCPSFLINVGASDGGSSSVGIEFSQNPTTPAPKDPPPKTDAPAADPKEPAGPPQADQRSGGSTQTTPTGSHLP
ncbi:LPXTG cell wall anchor domain-containing protein, partial [Enterococcus faecalis]|uniref:LPXTG cell wall anchor domain-containing protein n=1 Tax=Enterococcus faecalis TaxID=1351 RepID=UPI003D6AC8C9